MTPTTAPEKVDFKPTGLDWLGEIPSHWEVRRLKFCAAINPVKSSSRFNKESDENMVFLPMENVSEDGVIDNSIRKPIHELWNGYTYFEKNDIIVAKITPCFENGKGAYLNNLATEIGFGSTEFHVLRANEKLVNPNFLYLITRTHSFKVNGEKFMTGAAGQQRVPTDFIENFLVPLPPLEEQTAIVSFLNSQSARIDDLFYKKQRFIDLLREQKQALINEAVTKGIHRQNGNTQPVTQVEYSRFADAPWLAGVPGHWKVRRLKSIAKIFRGKFTHRPRNDERLYNGVYPFIQTGEVSQADKYITQYTQTLNEWGYSVSEEFPAGTLCMTIAANIADVAILNFNACFPDSNTVSSLKA